jgi:hypothetical protein
VGSNPTLSANRDTDETPIRAATGPEQARTADTFGMDQKPPTDAALEVATDRTIDAQEQFVQTPPGTGKSIGLAQKVERRAEDLDVLAEDAADEAARRAGSPADPKTGGTGS